MKTNVNAVTYYSHFAEYIRVPTEHVRHTTLPLPDALSAEEGSFVEPLACCIRAVRRTPLLPGDSVVVMGLGSIGLLMLQAIKAIAGRSESDPGSHHNEGDIRVYGVDLLPERLQLARSLGANDAFLAAGNEQGLSSALAPYTGGREPMPSLSLRSGSARSGKPWQVYVAALKVYFQIAGEN